jgi:hypothetical protein
MTPAAVGAWMIGTSMPSRSYSGVRSVGMGILRTRIERGPFRIAGRDTSAAARTRRRVRAARLTYLSSPE